MKYRNALRSHVCEFSIKYSLYLYVKTHIKAIMAIFSLTLQQFRVGLLQWLKHDKLINCTNIRPTFNQTLPKIQQH